ncbi:Photosystem II D1 precursor processing protein PSB27-H2, chloroplastic-like protein [Drosera capensis]
MTVLSGSKCPIVIAEHFKHTSMASSTGGSNSIWQLPLRENRISRRHSFVHGVVSLVAVLTLNQGMVSPPAWAEDKTAKKDDKDEGIFGTIKSLFDPNEKTKLGRVLPKAYLKSARELVKTLRESLKEDPNDMAKFRRTADSAKESIRDYLSNWKGQQTVVSEESYVELEKVIRSLANFYSKAGPSAPLSDEVKSEILTDLDIAEKFL